MHEEACTRSSFSAAGWTTVSQWRKSACLCKHQHLCVGAKLWHGHQPWTYRGHQWQLPGCKETVQASALEEHMYFPSHKKTVLCALLGGFSHKRPRFNAYGKCSSGWQMSQWRVLAFSASVQWKGPLPSPVFIPHRQLAFSILSCLGMMLPNVRFTPEDSKPCIARSLSLLPPHGGLERRTGDTKGKGHGLS